MPHRAPSARKADASPRTPRPTISSRPQGVPRASGPGARNASHRVGRLVSFDKHKARTYQPVETVYLRITPLLRGRASPAPRTQGTPPGGQRSALVQRRRAFIPSGRRLAAGPPISVFLLRPEASKAQSLQAWLIPIIVGNRGRTKGLA